MREHGALGSTLGARPPAPLAEERVPEALSARLVGLGSRRLEHLGGRRAERRPYPTSRRGPSGLPPYRRCALLRIGDHLRRTGVEARPRVSERHRNQRRHRFSGRTLAHGKQMPLRHGDVLKVGEVLLTFYDPRSFELRIESEAEKLMASVP